MHRKATSAYRSGLFEQRQTLRNTPGQGIRMAQIPGDCGEPGLVIPGLAQCQATCEQRDGLGESPLAEIHRTDTAIRVDQAEGMIDRLSHAEPVFSMSSRLTERTNLGQAPGQPGARED